MANEINDNHCLIDTAGIIFTRPIRIGHVTIHPNAADDRAIFKDWNDGKGQAKSSIWLADTTVTANPYIQSTGNFTAAVILAGDVIDIVYSASGNNEKPFSVASRDSNDQITVDGYPDETAEATIKYSWNVYTPETRFAIQSNADTSYTLDFSHYDNGRGLFMHNLFIDTLSASAKIEMILM